MLAGKESDEFVFSPLASHFLFLFEQEESSVFPVPAVFLLSGAGHLCTL